MNNEALTLINVARDELKGLKGYERADIALRLANILMMIEGTDVTPTREDLENTPAPVEKQEATPALTEEAKPLSDLNPQAPIADKILEGLSQPVETKVTAGPEKMEEPPVAAPAPAKQEIDINSEEWQNKILSSQELDEDWTPAMKANKDIVAAAQKLKAFITKGKGAGMLTDEWLNEEVKKATGGRIVNYMDKQAWSPKAIKLVGGHIIKTFMDNYNKKVA